MVAQLDAARNRLKSLAQELEGSSQNLPVLLTPLLTALGIEICWLESLEDGKAFLQYNRATGRPPKILLPKKEGKSPWTRFCAAHELAHFFIIKDFDLTPSNPREYWKIEEICDEFARLLLMPEALVADPLSQGSPSAKELWQLCADYSTLSRLPWTQVGKRISDFRSGVAYFKLERNKAGDYVVVSSSLRRDAGRGTKLVSGHADWHLCETLERARVRSGSDETEDWTDHLAPNGKLAKLMDQVGANAVVAQRMGGKLPHIRLVLGARS